jgi:hypothetical protein
MDNRLDELRVASERAIEKSRRLREDSEGIRSWSYRLLVRAEQCTRASRGVFPGQLPPERAR